MPESKNRIQVAVAGERVTFRVAGRATLDVTKEFKAACEALILAGGRQFALELAGCDTMDSTFLGTIVRLSRTLKAATPSGSVTLVAMTAKVRDQVSCLGVLGFFQIADAPADTTAEYQAVAGHPASKAEMAQVSLEAHQELISTSAENERRFRDVAAFLAEDLQRLGGSKG
jgi:anti-anti-sigma regulatory factor